MHTEYGRNSKKDQKIKTDEKMVLMFFKITYIN